MLFNYYLSTVAESVNLFEEFIYINTEAVIHKYKKDMERSFKKYC